MWTWATENLSLLSIHQVVHHLVSAVEESPGCQCSVWQFSNTRGPSAPVGAAAKRCDGGTCSCQAIRRMRPPSCQGSFPCLRDGDWCAQSQCTARSVQDKPGKEEVGREGTRHLQEETIWASRCLVQSVDISKNSSNVEWVPVWAWPQRAGAQPMHMGELPDPFFNLLCQKCDSLSSTHLKPAWVCWPDQCLPIWNTKQALGKNSNKRESREFCGSGSVWRVRKGDVEMWFPLAAFTC